MKSKLRTQCPTCHTTFALTRAQLDARAGLVRCGRCSAVFCADQYLLDPLPGPSVEQRTPPAKLEKKVSPGRRRQKNRKKRSKTEVSRLALPPDTDNQHHGALFPEEFVSEEVAQALTGTGKRRTRTRSILWGLGALLLLAALLAQTVFFYASDLAHYPQFKPWVLSACELLGCQIRPQQNVELIELLQTSVAPHPKRAHALRIRASMVNRADFTQPYPLMEITLTDTAGAAVARRTFTPRQYLKNRADANIGMTPHVVVAALLDISNPDPNPGGYEIRLLPR